MRLASDTRRLIAQTIRHRREELTARETWWQQQPLGDVRTEGFREINFWRNVYRDAERRLTDDADVRSDATEQRIAS
jgi:acyl-CoA reductase-like NAD-dependent aldehyde dehydrogenase